MTESPPAAKDRRRKVETPEQEAKRLARLAVQLADREHRAMTAMAAATGAPLRTRAHVLPLDKIDDEARRLEVWRARVERLEALLDRTGRKRETRAKIIVGATLLAEARSGRNDPLLSMFLEILDRRIDRPRDRLALAEALGLPLAPIKGAGSPALPDFEAMLEGELSRDAKDNAAPA